MKAVTEAQIEASRAFMREIATDGMAATVDEYTAQRPPGTASASAIRRRMKWLDFVQSCGLTPPPNGRPATRRMAKNAEQAIVNAMLANAQPADLSVRPMCLVCNDRPRGTEKRWNAALHVWEQLTVYGGGRFE